ncbi:hypothetical protein [Streptomyces sp. NPDC059631]|uniref:hypothetical protein n=1 Tax=unclassified Streptomyces TaxID=2593676 RepID=UPI00368F8C16
MTATDPQLTRPAAPQAAADAAAMLRSEISRADIKAGLLLALIGAALLAGIGAAAKVELPAVVGAAGLAAFLAGTVLLLLAVLPSLRGPGWPSWHLHTDTELYAVYITLAPIGCLTAAAVLTRTLR